MLSDEQVKEIEARANAATKGPWLAEVRNWPLGDTGDYEPCADVLAIHGDVAKPRAIGLFHELTSDVNAQVANCEFTAHARTDIPALCATVKQLRSTRYLAMAHDTQPYPTAEAYEKVCAALADHKSQLEQLRAENQELTRSLRDAYDFYMGPQACGDFTCACNEPKFCGICEIREATELVLADDLLATSPVVNCNPPEKL